MAKLKKPLAQSRLPFKFEQALPKGTNIAAYAFDKNGNFLQQGKIGKSEAYFNLSPKELLQTQVFFVPEFPEKEDPLPLSVEAMERRAAYQPVIRLDRRQQLTMLDIPARLISFWLWIRCRVNGTVTKRFLIDGVWKNLPICNARVHICEVDPIWIIIRQIPDEVVLRWREDILKPRLKPEVLPIPDPPPFELEQPLNLVDQVSAPTFSLNTEFSTQVTRPAVSLNLSNLQVDNHLMAKLQSPNIGEIRETLAQNFTLLYPYFCWWPYLWPWLRCDEIKTVMTDDNGRFDTNIYYQLFGDHPDLYFWVEQEIDGVWTTIYRPHRACYTYWNYQCGREVDIRVTHPDARPGCTGILHGSLAWVQTVGRYAPVRDIQQNNANINIQGANFNTIGLTDWRTNILGTYGLANQKVRPLGKTLEFWVYFGNQTGPGLPVSQYRWSYRKIRSAALGGVSASDQTWVPMTNGLSKPYWVEVVVGGITKVITKYYDLDPNNDGIFRIPPADASDIEPGASWIRRSTRSVVFDSNALKGNGLYEFKLEVFDAAGNEINVPNTFFQLTHTNGTESTPASPSFFTANTFRVRMRIDNTDAIGAMIQPNVNGTAASTECGFIAYGSKTQKQVRLSFQADHPQHFAIFHKRVIRGAGNVIADASDAGMVIASTSKYALTPGNTFRVKKNGTLHLTPKDLLGDCDKAAFSSRLQVFDLKTNGTEDDYWRKVDQTVAWALEP